MSSVNGRPETFAPISAVTAMAAGGALAGLAAAALALVLVTSGVALDLALLAAAGVALLVTALAAAPLLRGLGALSATLADLARAEPPTLPKWTWPLSSLFDQMAVVADRMAAVGERERQAADYRAELTRQVSEAAAREERNRLARELHDSIKQQLFSIDVSAAAARARATDSAATLDALAAIDGVRESARAAQAEMTALLQQLRPAPLENVGLVEALRDQMTALGYRSGAEASLSLGELPPAEALPARAQEEVFRIAQEALANVARHARARHVTLRLARVDGPAASGDARGALLLEVRDDGQGFDQSSARMGMGLSNIRERARGLGGTATISSAPGAGATVRVTIPLTPAPVAISPEERARLLAVESASGRGDWWRRWANNLIYTSFLLLLLGLPVWAVGLGFGLAAMAATATWAALHDVRRLAGADSEVELAQRKGASESLAGLLWGGALCAGYLTVTPPPGWTPPLTATVAAALVVAGIALGVWAWNGWRRASARWYRMLPPARRSREVARRWNETMGLWALIAIILIVAFFDGGWSPVSVPRTPLQWTDSASVALMVLLTVMNSVETWLVWRWRRAAMAAERAIQATQTEREARS